MSSWEVKDSVCRLVELTDEENNSVMQLCRECLNEIKFGLNSGADPEDPRVTAAAAGLAYYKIMLRRSTLPTEEAFTSFKAGDVSISQDRENISEKLKIAEEYCKTCMAKIAHLSQDNAFAFKNVRIKVIP